MCLKNQFSSNLPPLQLSNHVNIPHPNPYSIGYKQYPHTNIYTSFNFNPCISNTNINSYSSFPSGGKNGQISPTCPVGPLAGGYFTTGPRHT